MVLLLAEEIGADGRPGRSAGTEPVGDGPDDPTRLISPASAVRAEWILSPVPSLTMPGDRQVDRSSGSLTASSSPVSALVAVAIMVLPVAGAVPGISPPSDTIDLLVYNSTVQTAERRQHRAVDLALTYFKVPFDSNEDYVGSAPGGVPHGVWPDDCARSRPLVDTYGVYVDAEGNLDEDGTVRVSGTFPMAAAQDLVGVGGGGHRRDGRVQHSP